MKIISSVGAKGGSGKSSIALLTAWELSKIHKAKVAILDADVQGTCVSAKALNPEIPLLTALTKLVQKVAPVPEMLS